MLAISVVYGKWVNPSGCECLSLSSMNILTVLTAVLFLFFWQMYLLWVALDKSPQGKGFGRKRTAGPLSVGFKPAQQVPLAETYSISQPGRVTARGFVYRGLAVSARCVSYPSLHLKPQLPKKYGLLLKIFASARRANLNRHSSKISIAALIWWM